jgi:hypothetical protein
VLTSARLYTASRMLFVLAARREAPARSQLGQTVDRDACVRTFLQVFGLVVLLIRYSSRSDTPRDHRVFPPVRGYMSPCARSRRRARAVSTVSTG